MGSNPFYFQGDENRPVERVSWNDIMVSEEEKVCFTDTLNALMLSHPEYQVKLSQLAKAMGKKSIKFTLPSEAQWEYAARGGQENRGENGQWLNDYQYAGSNKIAEVTWYWDNSHRETKPVGLKKPNDLGLYDMSGNVWEWCLDNWHKNYEGAPNDGSAWIYNKISYRVVRGGSWRINADSARLADRSSSTPTNQSIIIGFRICLA